MNPPTESTALAPEQEAQLREALKRCSPATIEAARQFWQTGRTAYLPVIVTGVLERFVEPARRARLRADEDAARLVEDLALDSLTMMEIVMLTEEVLRITIDNEDLRRLQTVGDVKKFVLCKVRSAPGGS